MSLAPEDHPDDEPFLQLPDEPELTIDKPDVTIPKQDKNYTIGKPLVNDVDPETLGKFQGVKISMLGDTGSRIDADLEGNSGNTRFDVNENSVKWYNTLMQGFAAHPAKGIFEDALANPDARWNNALKVNEMSLAIGRPRFNNKGRGSQMSSERLTMSVRAQLGMGSPVQVPLYASGFHVTNKPLEEIEILGMWSKIVNDIVKLGRNTHGIIFSNNQVITAKCVAEAWKDAMMDTTVQDIDKDNLFRHISINDLPSIAVSMATALYPNGFPITRAVFNENSSLAKGEISQIIDVSKSIFLDENKLALEQKLHMAKRRESQMTIKTVKEYTDQFKFNQVSVIEIDEKIKLHLSTPSLQDYFDSGEKWISEIQASVVDALGEKAEPGARIPHISRLANATRLRQYSHYVQSIEEDGELYSSRDNVDRVLNTLSASNEISFKVYKAIADYIENTQVSIVATTSVNKYEDTKTGEMWPRLIPLDAMSTFFQLAEQRSVGIASRQLEDTSA